MFFFVHELGVGSRLPSLHDQSMSGECGCLCLYSNSLSLSRSDLINDS